MTQPAPEGLSGSFSSNSSAMASVLSLPSTLVSEFDSSAESASDGSASEGSSLSKLPSSAAAIVLLQSSSIGSNQEQPVNQSSGN